MPDGRFHPLAFHAVVNTAQASVVFRNLILFIAHFVNDKYVCFKNVFEPSPARPP